MCYEKSRQEPQIFFLAIVKKSSQLVVNITRKKKKKKDIKMKNTEKERERGREREEKKKRQTFFSVIRRKIIVCI